MIVNAGIRRVIYEQGYPDPFTLEIFGETGVKLEKYPEPEQASQP
jgi:dCMP deaminase